MLAAACGYCWCRCLFHFYLWHATYCRLLLLPSVSSFLLSLALCRKMTSNKFEFATLSSSSLSCRCIPNPITYVCVNVCECDVRVLVCVWVCICICKIFSAAATTTATAVRRTASAEKWQTESHMLHLPLIYWLLCTALSLPLWQSCSF